MEVFSKLMIVGPLVSKSTGVNPRDGRVWCRFGFIVKDERGAETVDLFMPDAFDHTSYFEGQEVELPVRAYVNKEGVKKYAYAGERQPAVAARPVARPKAVG